MINYLQGWDHRFTVAPNGLYSSLCSWKSVIEYFFESNRSSKLYCRTLLLYFADAQLLRNARPPARPLFVPTCRNFPLLKGKELYTWSLSPNLDNKLKPVYKPLQLSRLQLQYLSPVQLFCYRLRAPLPRAILPASSVSFRFFFARVRGCVSVSYTHLTLPTKA